MLGSHKPDGPFTQQPGTTAAYVVTADVGAVWQRASDAGLEPDALVERTTGAGSSACATPRATSGPSGPTPASRGGRDPPAAGPPVRRVRSPAALGQPVRLRDLVDVDAHHGLAEAARDLGDDVGVVEEGGGLDDRLGALRPGCRT